MSKLALEGGEPEVCGPIRRFNTIGQAEVDAAVGCLWGYPLSGFLGGEPRGGWHVCELERLWCERFGVKHAVAVNSATSGLFIAAQTVPFLSDYEFVVPPYTMSASAAAPMLAGGSPDFIDIEPDTFTAAGPFHIGYSTRGLFVTNLFGHPAHLAKAREIADSKGILLIEDNAQSIGAMENGKYAGTIGHIGVWSLNVHKILQVGEGGIVTTDDDDIVTALRGQMNHGEMSGGPPGLNLRMTELTAAVAIAQLNKLDDILASRRGLAERITEGVRGLPVIPPVVRHGCTHSWCAWACKIEHDRDRIVEALRAEGVPIRAGYMRPLYELPAFAPYKRPCPVTERVESQIALIEIASIAPTAEQTDQIIAAFHKVYEHMKVTA